MLPEQVARQKIDSMLNAAGWAVQDMNRLNLGAAHGVAVREYPTDSGPADYILFVNRIPLGVIEAKAANKGAEITAYEGQSARYAKSKLKWRTEGEPLRFVYESTGVITHFTDNLDPSPRARDIFNFHTPVTLGEWAEQADTLRARLKKIPKLPKEGLRECQINAITKLSTSFAQATPRALIQMATGAGKTFTAITAAYRLLKFANARRILFLVDTRNLGQQAAQEFQAFKPNDDNHTFTELYNVQHLSSRFIDPASHVCISTIQRMYSILKGVDLDAKAEEVSLNEAKSLGTPREVVYNPDIPIEEFDFIIIDECHRSIYDLFGQVLDYFDSFRIGLTATPDSRTYAYFDRNVVSEYTHERAVADGVNVGYDVYTIDTKISRHGGKIKAKQWVDKRQRQTREKTYSQLDQPLTYTAKQLDNDVVSPDQIRTIIRTFKNQFLKDVFPERFEEVPKTLIFAKSDSHADDIISIVRTEFGEGNDFCRKITYNTSEDKLSPLDVLQQFRTAYNPRIAVTVDMVATGTDVKPIECLLFMRDVRSRNYFEQMKGRGTRTMSEDDLRKVTPGARNNKSRFVIIDAVGVCKSHKTDSRPLERKPNVPLRDLLRSVAIGARDEDTITSLANRLTRLEKQVTETERRHLKQLAGGKSVNTVVKELLDSFDPDVQNQKAQTDNRLSDTQEPSPKQVEKAHKQLVEAAVRVFDSPDLREFIENVRKSHEQVIDAVNLDKVLRAGWDKQAKKKAKETVRDFKKYCEQNKDRITALRIFYAQPYRRRELTFRMLSDLCDHIKQHKPLLAPALVWNAYQQLDNAAGTPPPNEIVALIALIRRTLEIDETLTPFDSTVNKNFQKWVFKKQAGTLKFNEQQMEWLRMIKDYIAASVHVERDDFELSPFDRKGGLGKAFKLFGSDLDKIVEELNAVLAA